MQSEFEIIKDAVASVLPEEAGEITLRTRLIEDLGADSLELFEILTVVEERQALHFPADAVNNY